MPLLHEIGIVEDSPSEIILTTFSPEGEPHPAAIGVRAKGDEKVKIKLFTETRTYRNITSTSAAVVNVVNDAKFLVRHGLPDVFAEVDESIEFRDAKEVDAPYLSNADAIVEFEVESMEEEIIEDRIGRSELTNIVGSVKNIEVKGSSPHPFKRSELYLIESAVLATKAIEAGRKGKADVCEDFVREVEYFKEKCVKIAPQSAEAEMIKRIANFLREGAW